MRYRKRILLLAVLILSAACLVKNATWAKQKISFEHKNITMTAGESRKLSLNGISKKNQDRVAWFPGFLIVQTFYSQVRME